MSKTGKVDISTPEKVRIVLNWWDHTVHDPCRSYALVNLTGLIVHTHESQLVPNHSQASLTTIMNT